MASSDVYRLTLSLPYRILIFGVITLMSMAGIAMIVSAVSGYQNGPPLPVAVLWSAIVFWNWLFVLRIPYEIRFEPGDQISFVALTHTKKLRLTDLRSLKLEGGGNFYVLRHREGKFRILIHFTGVYEVVSRIKGANPDFETVGI